MKITKHIPNTITCLNLISGCIAVWLAFKGAFGNALLAISIAAIFDFCDGLAARLLKAYSYLGKELDSLADVVSFGFAPGALVFSVLEASQAPDILKFAGFIIPAFSALRLAKFNLDERQTTSFIGLPVPANAIFWGGLVFAFSDFLTTNWWFLLVLTVIFSILLISEIPMFSLKIKGLAWRDNKIQYIFLAVCLTLFAVFGMKSIAFFIICYIVFSIALNVSREK
ncbi:MAG: CDP-diacylglycerol--serine O-phosphatidyltransferase [Prevotellaceae bacterium]|jgi:CDP-diacylglycerol--serine O-phosphatidyltransferase|nr:CDP-diacylglycerol--serine O-phosphatidyltransferase [Prevotellaceae bacterium]